MLLSPTSAPLPDQTFPDREVLLQEGLLDRLLHRALKVHAEGLKAFGLLVAAPDEPGYPYCASDVVIFDPTHNRRNHPSVRPAFEAQGSYFRAYEDAGFVADSAEVLAVHRRLEARGLEPVALFHTHRRQPANFSSIDYRLHNPAYAWHLIISLREPRVPVLRAFAVDKSLDDFGIDPSDANEDSQCDYLGPEVAPLRIATAEEAAA